MAISRETNNFFDTQLFGLEWQNFAMRLDAIEAIKRKTFPKSEEAKGLRAVIYSEERVRLETPTEAINNMKFRSSL